jgi:IclR family acetate operon transcriptional repressor
MTMTTNAPSGDARGATSAVDRALDLLTALIDSRTPLTLAEAAARAGLPKPTAHRILGTLVARGLVRQEPDRTYRLGSTLFGLAGAVLGQVDYAREAQDGLRWLQTVTPETIHFAALIGDEVVYVDKIEGRRPYRMASAVGMGLLMHCTSIGKAVLAFLPPERRAPYFAADLLEKRTANTITKLAALDAELETIQQRGFAIDDAENEDNIRCIGTPVFDAAGAVIGGISVSAPTFHLSLDDAVALAPAVMHAGRMISESLGAPAQALPPAYGGRAVVGG